MISRRSVLFALAPSLHAAKGLNPVALFKRGEAGVHTYRIPALIETRKGTLLAVADARHDGPGDLPARISLVMRTSRDRGDTWSPAVTIRNVEQGGVGDPSLLLDRGSGRVWCFHICAAPGVGFGTPQASRMQVHAMFSDDEGAAWSEPRDLSSQLVDPSWRGAFATSGTHAQTSTGRYLLPLVVRDGQGIVSSRNAYSDDGGKTWNTSKAIGAGTDESHAIELAGGVILQNMRNGNRRAIAWSSDGGITFGPVTHDEALIDPGCNAGIARHRDLLIFTNAASLKRENLTVKLSRDRGKTWSPGRAIHPGPAAYSSVIVLRDGSVAVLYECGESSPYERIAFARFPVKRGYS